MPGNVADAILKMLAENGVKSLYGISGDAIFPLLDAVSRQKEIKFYSTAHESSAALMASYEAKLTGRLAACTATSGPGTVNLLNGLADAFFDQAPVLAVTGQVETKKIGTNTKQYFNQNNLVKSFSLFSETLASPQALKPVLAAAIGTALNENTAAHISVPRDVFLKPAEACGFPVVRGKSREWGSGFADLLAKSVEILNSLTRPVILLGSRSGETARAVCELAEGSGAAIVTAQQVIGVIPYNQPRMIGGIGQGYIPALLSKADGILIIGEAPYELDFLPRGIPVLQIAEKTSRLHFELIQYGITGDPAVVTRALIQRVSRQPVKDHWSRMIAEEKETRQKMISQDEQIKDAPVHPARLIAELNRFTAEDAVIALDIGSFMHWFERGFLACRQTVLLSGRWRCMGSGLPAAIAAKIARPEKQVVALVGDGGLLISLGEFMTAVRYGLPITVIVFRNGSYNLEKYGMIAEGMNPFGTELVLPDFAEFAKACGGQGYKVDNPGQLMEVLPAAFNCQVPVIVDAATADVPLISLK